MKLLTEYFQLQKEIYSYFGYKEDWVVIPIDDARSYFWVLTADEVIFSEAKNDVISNIDGEYSGNGYSNSIYRQCFLPKWIYPGKEYTMICVDTHTDGNKFLQVFDNSKRIHNGETK